MFVDFYSDAMLRFRAMAGGVSASARKKPEHSESIPLMEENPARDEKEPY